MNALPGYKYAFDYAKKKALEAHHIGDGNKVNLNTALVLNQVQISQRNSKKDQNKSQDSIPLADWWWSLALGLYWLVDHQTLSHWGEALERANIGSDVKELKKVLSALIELVWEPLYERENLLDNLWDLEFSWINKENTQESEALLGFIIEILFIRDIVNMEKRWQKLATHWIDKLEGKEKTNRLAQKLKRIRTRLQAQSKVVWPGIHGKDPEDLDTFFSSMEKELYTAWKSWPEMKWQDLDQTLQKLVNLVPDASPYIISISRLHHSTRYFRGFKGDPDIISAMRSRITVGFDTVRSRILRESVEAAWRKDDEKGNKANGAYIRSHALRLAALAQIDALRRWDLIAWYDAGRELYRINLELTQHDKMSPKLARDSLWWGTISLNLDPKDKLVQRAVGALDMAEDKYRNSLVKALLRTRPIEYAYAGRLFNLLSDAIPVELLLDVAKWSVNVAKWSVKYFETPNRGFYSEVFTLSFWADILPTVDRDSAKELCLKLKPAMDICAQAPAVWQLDSGRKGMITQYLKHTPLDVAVEIALQMFKLNIDDKEANDARWILIYNAAIDREEFGEKLKEKLKESQPGNYLRFYAQYLDEKSPDLVEKDQIENRTYAKSGLIKFADNILNAPPGRESIFGPAGVPTNLVGRIEWTEDDWDIIEKLISVVDKDQACSHLNKGQALGYIAKIISNGPKSLATRLCEHIIRWLNNPPEGRSQLDDLSGPMSAFQYKGPDKYYVMSNLLFLTSEALVRNPDDSDSLSEVAANFVMKQRMTCNPKIWAEIVFLAMTIVKHGPAPMSEQMAFSAHMVIIRALENIKVIQNSGENFLHLQNHIVPLMGPAEGVYSAFSIKNENVRNIFLDTVTVLLQQTSKHWNHEIRVVSARILKNWKNQARIPNELESIVKQLENDSRGIVRLEMGN